MRSLATATHTESLQSQLRDLIFDYFHHSRDSDVVFSRLFNHSEKTTSVEFILALLNLIMTNKTFLTQCPLWIYQHIFPSLCHSIESAISHLPRTFLLNSLQTMRETPKRCDCSSLSITSHQQNLDGILSLQILKHLLSPTTLSSTALFGPCEGDIYSLPQKENSNEILSQSQNCFSHFFRLLHNRSDDSFALFLRFFFANYFECCQWPTKSIVRSCCCCLHTKTLTNIDTHVWILNHLLLTSDTRPPPYRDLIFHIYLSLLHTYVTDERSFSPFLIEGILSFLLYEASHIQMSRHLIECLLQFCVSQNGGGQQNVKERIADTMRSHFYGLPLNVLTVSSSFPHRLEMGTKRVSDVFFPFAENITIEEKMPFRSFIVTNEHPKQRQKFEQCFTATEVILYLMIEIPHSSLSVFRGMILF
jgi:hypothetical protein